MDNKTFVLVVVLLILLAFSLTMVYTNLKKLEGEVMLFLLKDSRNSQPRIAPNDEIPLNPQDFVPYPDGLEIIVEPTLI